MTQKFAFSGIQSSGQPSLGNFLGAYKPFVAIQETHDVFYCVVDHHSITVRQDPKKLTENSYAIAAWFLASGLDPEQCDIFIQSHNPHHTELGWILNTFTQMGELERMTQFKDKAQRHSTNVNAGLFTYPSLMAADILLYQTHEVPVGDDQRQHLELTRDIAIRMNNHYTPDSENPLFIVPEAIYPKAAARVMDLQTPENKMSKSSEGLGTVFLIDDLKTIEKKFKKAVTDNVGAVHLDKDNQAGIYNLLDILAACTNKDIKDVAAEWDGQQYGGFKAAVADAVCSTLEPVQKRYHELMDDKAELQRILKRGAERAQERSTPTLERVKDAIGYVRPF